jgi:hypothetical protein
MTDRLNARCHCGKIHLTLPATAAGVLACHCDDCQKMHGNFNAFLAVPVSDVEATGTEHLVWYRSSASARRAFCATCGARVLKEVTEAGPLADLRRPDRMPDRPPHHQEPLGRVETRLVRPAIRRAVRCPGAFS